MSKIMRQIYAEARAAREAAAMPIANPSIAMPMADAIGTATIEPWSVPLPNSVESALSTIEWWTTQYEKTGKDTPAKATARRNDGVTLDMRACNTWVRDQTARIVQRHQQFGRRGLLDIDALLARIAK
jgi:hypothetical protein